MSIIKWLLFLPTNLFGGALAMGLQVAGRITPELLLCASMKGAHDATTN